MLLYLSFELNDLSVLHTYHIYSHRFGMFFCKSVNTSIDLHMHVRCKILCTAICPIDNVNLDTNMKVLSFFFTAHTFYQEKICFYFCKKKGSSSKIFDVSPNYVQDLRKPICLPTLLI
jgi:hypothetical protein